MNPKAKKRARAIFLIAFGFALFLTWAVSALYTRKGLEHLRPNYQQRPPSTVSGHDYYISF